MPYRHTLLFLLATLTTIDASAWSRIADAHVHSVNGMPAPELQTGRVYSIFLNGRPNDPSDPTYGYMGKFCIVATATGERNIIAIGSDTPAWRQDSCPEHSLIR